MFEGRKISKILGQFAQLDDAGQFQAADNLKSYGATALPYIIESMKTRQILIVHGKKILTRAYQRELLKEYVALLAEPRDDIRGMLKEVLLASAGAAGVPEFIENLNHQDFHVRRACSDLLGQLANPGIIPRLAPYLKSQQKDIKKNVIEILGRVGGVDATKHLTVVLTDGDWSIRRKAVEAICATKDPAALKPLAELLEREKDPQIVKTVLDAFIKIGNKIVIPVVMPLLRNDDMIIRQKAVDVLGAVSDAELIPQLVELVHSQDVNIRRAAVEVLNRIKDPNAGKVLIKCLKDGDWWVREIATDALAEISSGNINGMLMGLLADKDENIRRSAIEYFNRIVYPPSFDLIVKLLEDNDWWIREKAVTALGNMKDPRAIPHIIKRINDTEIKWVIPQALGKIGTKEVSGALVKLLSDGERKVQLAALQALGETGDNEVLPYVKRMVSSPDDEIANTALHILKERTGKTYLREKSPQPVASGDISTPQTPASPQPASQPAVATVSGNDLASLSGIVSSPIIPEGTALREAILVLDMVSSTKNAAKYGDHFAMKLLQTLLALATPLAAKHHASFIKSTGDGFLMTFPQAPEAVRFAMEMLASIVQNNQNVTLQERIAIRIAVTNGDTIIGPSGDRIGTAVNMAFRIEGVKSENMIECDGGMKDYELPAVNRILVSNTVHEEIRQDESLSSQLTGLFELKGIDGQHKLYLVRQPGAVF